MTIQVLGSGCPTCKKLLERTNQVVGELKLQASVEYITDVHKIIDMGLMQSPVLTIDNKPILVGKVPDVDKLKSIIQDSLHLNKE